LSERLTGLSARAGPDEPSRAIEVDSESSRAYSYISVSDLRVKDEAIHLESQAISVAFFVRSHSGGSPPRPGEISLAHGGVLFLDETPEFPRRALEALREPLETGRITISRAARQAAFPARFQLVAAMNPCPCGYLGARAASARACTCTPDAVARYQGRLSGPLLDRIDLRVELTAVSPAELMAAPDGEPSAAVAARVAAARQRQIERQGEPNGQLEGRRIDAMCRADDAARRLLQSAAERFAWSSRRLHRSLKVARTLADLEGAATIAAHHVAEALQLQRAGS
ncbi:MAG: ATP-binding protein, partial [Burkholderiales bacterium]|nr:ATP-binding protein [Burkholderiales bacterium]